MNIYLQRIEELRSMIDQYQKVTVIIDNDEHGGRDLRMLLLERFELIPIPSPTPESVSFEIRKLRHP